MRWVGLAIGLAAVTAAALVTHAVPFVWQSQQCSVGFDTGSAPPADASPQGWMCSEYASTLGSALWLGGWLLSVVLTVVVVVIAWRRWRWGAVLVAIAALVLLPGATSILLNLPPDDCTAHARATHPDWACVR